MRVFTQFHGWCPHDRVVYVYVPAFTFILMLYNYTWM